MSNPLDRRSELETILESEGWRAIAKIAKGLNVQKHEDGWLETIPDIVSAEMAKVTKLETIESVVETVPESPVVVDEVVICEMKQPIKYATEQFIRNGFLYCFECGAQKQTDMNDRPICPESRKNCPQLI